MIVYVIEVTFKRLGGIAQGENDSYCGCQQNRVRGLSDKGRGAARRIDPVDVFTHTSKSRWITDGAPLAFIPPE